MASSKKKKSSLFNDKILSLFKKKKQSKEKQTFQNKKYVDKATFKSTLNKKKNLFVREEIDRYFGNVNLPGGFNSFDRMAYAMHGNKISHSDEHFREAKDFVKNDLGVFPDRHVELLTNIYGESYVKKLSPIQKEDIYSSLLASEYTKYQNDKLKLKSTYMKGR